MSLFSARRIPSLVWSSPDPDPETGSGPAGDLRSEPSGQVGPAHRLPAPAWVDKGPHFGAPSGQSPGPGPRPTVPGTATHGAAWPPRLLTGTRSARRNTCPSSKSAYGPSCRCAAVRKRSECESDGSSAGHASRSSHSNDSTETNDCRPNVLSLNPTARPRLDESADQSPSAPATRGPGQ